MANKKSRFTRTGTQAALVWHSVRTVARAPPWKYVTNAAAVREAPRIWRGFRFSIWTIIGVRQIAPTFGCTPRVSTPRTARSVPSCGSAQSRIAEQARAPRGGCPWHDAVQADLDTNRPRPKARSLADPFGQLPAKQRGSPALLLSGLGPRYRKCPPPFAETPESCQAKSEPCGTKSAYPLGAGLDLPPPSNVEHGCDICLRRSSPRIT